MASDTNLIQGAAAAYKDRDAAGMKRAGMGLDKITAAANAWRDTKIAEQKAEDKKIEALQTKLNEQITTEAATSKALGKSEYNAFKKDARAIRDRLLEAKRSGDIDAQQDAQIELNELMTSSQKLKDRYEAIGESIPELDMKAMTQEGRDAFENFKNNPTREHFRNEDGEDAYRWQVLDENGQPVQDTNEDGSPKVDPDTQQPVYKTQSYTPDQINDLGVMPQTANGKLLKDFELELAENYEAGGSMDKAINVRDVRAEVADLIPKTPEALRSWAKSNPTENHKLNVGGYLLDNISRLGNYSDLGVVFENLEGVEDKQKEGEPGYGVIDENDLISDEDKGKLVDAIMNADYPDISHGILTEVYTNITYNRAIGKENYDYDDGADNMLDGSSAETQDERDKVLTEKQKTNLVELKKDPKPGETPKAMAKRLDMDVKDTIWDEETQKFISIQSLYATAANKKAIGDTSKF
mgnify:CR=1 FL=1